MTFGSRGTYLTTSIPGTGLYQVKKVADSKPPSTPAPSPETRLRLGFFERLFTPRSERAFVEGLRLLAGRHEDEALERLREAEEIADAAFIAGFLLLKRGNYAESARLLESVLGRSQELGKDFAKYGVDATLLLPITPEIGVEIAPNARGVGLGLVEAYQLLDRTEEALSMLENLLEAHPSDVAVRLSLAELLLDLRPRDRRSLERIATLVEGLENETPVHTALLLYKARALRGLGLLEAARKTLTEALKRKKDRPPDLLRALRYERALVYEALGQRSRARRELEQIYAEDPNFEDVAERLGVGSGDSS